MVGYSIGNGDPAPFHAINILFHVAASLATYWVAWGLFRDPRISFWGALLFAAHPMHSESVAWIAALPELGCGFFYFLSFAAFLRMVRTNGTQRTIYFVLSLSAFLLSVLYKEMALTLPLMIIVTDLLLFRGEEESSWRSRMKKWLPYLGVLALYMIWRFRVLGFFATRQQQMEIEISDRILTVVYFCGRYIEALVSPFAHSAYHVFRPFSQVDVRDWALPFILLAIFVSLIFQFQKKNQTELLLLVLWFLITLSPVLNFDAIGRNAFTERYLYIPSLGFCLLMPALVYHFFAIQRPKFSALLFVIVVTALTILTVGRNRVWRDNETLFTETLRVSPDAAPIHNNLGNVYYASGQLESAKRKYSDALAADSRSFFRYSRDRYNSLIGFSLISSSQNKFEEALNYAEKAMGLRPDLAPAYQIKGTLLGRKGSYEEAKVLLERSIKLEPYDPLAHGNLGNVLMELGRFEEAELEFRTALQLDPLSASIRAAMGLLLFRLNRTPDAQALINEALELEPNNKQVQRAHAIVSSGR